MKQLQKMEVNTLKELINYQFTAAAPFTLSVKKPKLMAGLGLIPDAPGVYYFLNEKKQIVYIGKAKSLQNRLRSYISPSAIGKTKRIIKKADQVKVQQTATELTAFLLEAELIKLIGPRMNVQLKKYREKYFLKVDNSHPFPSISITNDMLFDGNDYFGLFINRRKAAELFDLINRIFAIRECNDKEFKKGKACFLAEIERCTAPCEHEDSGEYNAELERVFDFMAGKNQTALDRLLNKMKRYSDDLKFEKAQEVKELVQMVMAQIQKSALLTEPVNRANVLFEVSHTAQRTDYVLLLQGRVFVNNYLINSERNFHSALEDFYNGVIIREVTPGEEDLEKIKTTLNWIIKNRHQVSVYYLKSYNSLEQLGKSLQWKLNQSLELPEITIKADDFLVS
ncbi:MAG: GIY-YIG nuclease family protein [Ignavibacteriales bacterium]|nr:GIY-YIG nuclease family protein [Ignavibacteriales bacterium]